MPATRHRHREDVAPMARSCGSLLSPVVMSLSNHGLVPVQHSSSHRSMGFAALYPSCLLGKRCQRRFLEALRFEVSLTPLFACLQAMMVIVGKSTEADTRNCQASKPKYANQ